VSSRPLLRKLQREIYLNNLGAFTFCDAQGSDETDRFILADIEFTNTLPGWSPGELLACYKFYLEDSEKDYLLKTEDILKILTTEWKDKIYSEIISDRKIDESNLSKIQGYLRSSSLLSNFDVRRYVASEEYKGQQDYLRDCFTFSPTKVFIVELINWYCQVSTLPYHIKEGLIKEREKIQEAIQEQSF